MPEQERKSNFATITQRVRSVEHREVKIALLRGFAFSCAFLFLVILAAAGIEAVFRLSPAGRLILSAGALIAAAGILAWQAGPALLRMAGFLPRTPEDAMALRIGSHFPHIKDRLLNALQVYRDLGKDRGSAASPRLVEASFDDVAREVVRLDFTPVVSDAPARLAARTALYSFCFTGLLFLLFPGGLFNAAYRVIHFNRQFLPPAPFTFEISPGSKEVVKGETIPILIRIKGEPQPVISLFTREEGQTDFDRIMLRPDSTGLFRYTFENIRSSIRYYASAREYPSPEYALTMIDRPLIRNLRVRISPPAYTRLPTRYLEDNTGDVSALAGTAIDFDLTLNKEIVSAALLLNDSLRVPMQHEGAAASGRLRLTKTGSYSFELTDAAGIRNADPIRYALNVLPDLPPAVRIVEPQNSTTDIAEDMRLPMLLKISDDYGFSRMRLAYKLVSSKYEKPAEEYSYLNIPLPIQAGTEAEVPYLWNCNALNLVPEDVVSYYVEVFDNDAVNGPKSARSAIYTLRLPSMEEVFARADKTQEKAVDELKKSLNDVEKLQKELEDVHREMKKTNLQQPADWQQKKKLEEILKRQEELTKKVDDVTGKLNQMTQEMQQHNLMSEETVRKYQELQQLMQQMNIPELQQAMKKLQEAMKNVSPEMMKQALENMQFNEEMFRQSIERTMELLKRLQIEQKTDELSKRAEDLAGKQEELAKRTEQANGQNAEEMQKLAREQEELREQAQAMQKELSELRKMMEEFPQDMPLQELQEAQSEMNLNDMQSQMSQSAGMCQGGNKQGAAQQQKKTADQLRKFQKKMDQVKKKLRENQDRAVMNAFRKALQDVLQLSERQESLKNASADLPPNSQQFRQGEEEQQQISELLRRLADDLMKLSKKTFSVTPDMAQHIGRAMQQMQQSMESMEQRNGEQARSSQTSAMGELNEAAKKIAQAMQSQSGGQAGGGMSLMQQLQRMAMQQQAINQGTQQLGEGQMSMEARAQMQRLLGQQAALQKTLQQLEEESKRSQDGSRILGDLNKIAEDMQEVVRDMQQENVNPETIQRQEKILSRLLDASRSARERDYEKKRRSETGQDVVRRSPADIDPSLLEEKQGIQRDLQKAIQEGYSKDYEELIRKYFNTLQQMTVQPGGTP